MLSSSSGLCYFRVQWLMMALHANNNDSWWDAAADATADHLESSGGEGIEYYSRYSGWVEYSTWSTGLRPLNKRTNLLCHWRTSGICQLAGRDREWRYWWRVLILFRVLFLPTTINGICLDPNSFGKYKRSAFCLNKSCDDLGTMDRVIFRGSSGD